MKEQRAILGEAAAIGSIPAVSTGYEKNDPGRPTRGSKLLGFGESWEGYRGREADFDEGSVRSISKSLPPVRSRKGGEPHEDRLDGPRMNPITSSSDFKEFPFKVMSGLGLKPFGEERPDPLIFVEVNQ